MGCIYTSDELKEWLSNIRNGFITATIGEKEYAIENIQRVKTHANADDSFVYYTLNLCESSSSGCMKKGR